MTVINTNTAAQPLTANSMRDKRNAAMEQYHGAPINW